MMSFVIKYWSQISSIVISLFSVIFSAKSYNSNRAKIYFMKVDDPTSFLEPKQIRVYSDNKVIYEFPVGILIHINVLNSSPKDVAYFSLHFEIDGKIVSAYTQKSLGYLPNEHKTFVLESDKFNAEIPVPVVPQGKFLANSDTAIYTFARLDDYLISKKFPKTIVFKLNYAMKKWWNPFSKFSTKTIKVKKSTFRAWKATQLLLNRQYLLPMLSDQMTIKPFPLFLIRKIVLIDDPRNL